METLVELIHQSGRPLVRLCCFHRLHHLLSVLVGEVAPRSGATRLLAANDTAVDRAEQLSVAATWRLNRFGIRSRSEEPHASAIQAGRNE